MDRKVEYDAAGRATYDTTRTRQSDGKGGVLLVDTISRTTYDLIGTVESVSTQTNRYSNANAYSGWIDGGQGAASGNSVNSTTSYFYDWYQGAVQTSINYNDGATSQVTRFTIANEAGQAVTKKATINDGRSRTVIFDTDVSGQVIRRRESDNNTSQGDPSSVWYRFAGRQMGMVTNNGGWEGSYAASVTQRQTAPLSSAPGAFANGATVGKQEAQFSSNLEVINSYSQGSVAGTYVVRSGDSLQGIAQNLWGDSGLWYKLAQANGLSGNAALFEGQSLRLPAGVIRNTYNASTITPYNPAETLGDVTPSTPQAAPPKKQKCGALGQIFLVIIAVAVTFAAPFGGGIIGGALNAAAGSVVSQVVGVATGIQEKFDWKGVALAAISGGVGGAVSGATAGITNSVARAVVQGATTSAISQGIGVALGLQDRFSWAAVAAAGVGAGVGQAVGGAMGKAGINVKALSSRVGVGMAGAVAQAATLSLIEGTDFGDNLRASLPSVLGNAVGGYLIEGGGSGPGLLDYVTSQITYSPSNVANQTIAQILKDNPNMSAEQIDRLKGKGPEWKADIADARRLAKKGDIAAAGTIQRRIMDETLSFYPQETQEAAMALLASPERSSGIVSTAGGGADEVIVVNGKFQYGRAFGLLDRPGVLAGRLKNNVEGEIGAWLDKTPGAKAALSMVEVGMAIGGGPLRFAAAMAMDAANQQIVQKTTGRFEAAGYGPEMARAGGEGLPWLAGIGLGSVKLGGKSGSSINGELSSIWTSTGSKSGVQNAFSHWKKHGVEFPEFTNSKQYVEGTLRFVSSPPAGTLTKIRPNGDTVLYNPTTNTFAVREGNGVPKTMFRPNPAKHGYPTNLDYFNAQ